MANKPPNNRVDLLKDRNSKLGAQVAVQRKEIDRLQRCLDDLESKEEERQETVLCVNRLWEELNGAISFLSFRTTGRLSTDGNDPEENGDGDLLEQANPFLAKLLSSFIPSDRLATSTAKSLVEDISEVETALRKRMSATMDAACRVLEAVEENRFAAASAATPGDGGTPGTGGSSAAKESQLAALNNLLKAENNRLRDQSLQDASKIKELESNLADKEDELLVAHRKILQLKEAGATAVRASSAAPGPATAADGTGAAAPTPAAGHPVADGPGVEQLKRLLEKRDAQVEERDAALSRSEREARELRAKLTSERESAARARQYAHDRNHHLSAEIDSLDARLRDLHRERDHLLARLRDMQMDAERGMAAERRLAQTRAHIGSLEGQVATARAKRAEAEAEVDRLRATIGTAPTAEELSKMVGNLEKDVASLKTSRDKYKAAADGAEAARTAAVEASKGLAESQAQLETVRRRLETARQEAAGWAAERRAAAEREEDLRLFAEVAQTFLGRSDNGEIPAMKEQIAQFLENQAMAVTQRLEAAAAAGSAGSAGPTLRETELLSQVESLQEERAVLTARVEELQREAESLRTEASGLREDGEAVLREVESVSEAYEAAQEQNARLLKSIATRDEDNVRLLREAAAATRERSAMVEERDRAVEVARRAEEVAAMATGRADELESRVNALALDLENTRKEARQLSARADAAVRDMAAAQATLDAATRDAEAARKEAAERAAERDAEAEALRRERTRAERAEADAADLQTRATRLERVASGNAGAGGAGSELTAENAALRKMVNCNVCHARLKDRIITKCNHIFCSHCIDANLANRHRKCPGCGDRFGASDVKAFYFT